MTAGRGARQCPGRYFAGGGILGSTLQKKFIRQYILAARNLRLAFKYCVLLEMSQEFL